MKILNNIQNEAVLSNVSKTGEFRIKNSARAFSILSSGLYANKIRAIIRELSCNARDSHVAANKATTPFDVHLPSMLEPWFSIRDYGLGLTHDQVTNIYTTYFESTKTESNDFVGALGLGSKSPFSYTDNFAVIAIKDGEKGIYTAFINDNGVPSIAVMSQSKTDEPNGVEVKFSVESRDDCYRFVQEAQYVYQYFDLKPIVSGVSNFKIPEITYADRDIIPGVHSYSGYHGHGSVAVMGNIPYPIEVPSSDKTMGTVSNLLKCNLEMHFDIGELDFQASREGLSYIPQTIESIKKKLELVNDNLTVKLAKDADAIKNLWDRAVFLAAKHNTPLWQAAVEKYVTDTKFELFVNKKSGHYSNWAPASFSFSEEDLQKKYNIMMRAFSKGRGTRGVNTVNARQQLVYGNIPGVPSTSIRVWQFDVNDSTSFVVNDTKVGAAGRAKYHWNQNPPKGDAYSHTVYVLEAFDRALPIDSKQFFKDIMEPSKILKVSELVKKEAIRNVVDKDVSILKLERRSQDYSRRNANDMVWRACGELKSFDDKEIHYYLPLIGFKVSSEFGNAKAKDLHRSIQKSGITSLKAITKIFGVRKDDLDEVKAKKNWVNLEEYIVTCLKTIDQKNITSLVKNILDSTRDTRYTKKILNKVTNVNSPFNKFFGQFNGIDGVVFDQNELKTLFSIYGKDVKDSPEARVQKALAELQEMEKRYSLIKYLYDAPDTEIVNYINLIDSTKGV
jgi:hypothetical protein